MFFDFFLSTVNLDCIRKQFLISFLRKKNYIYNLKTYVQLDTGLFTLLKFSKCLVNTFEGRWEHNIQITDGIDSSFWILVGNEFVKIYFDPQNSE